MNSTGARGRGIHTVGAVRTLLWAEHGSPLLTPVLTAPDPPPPAHVGHPWPPRTSHGRAESTHLFAEWATPRTGSRRRGLRASSGEGWPVPLGPSDFALHLKKENKRVKSFSVSSQVWETSDAYRPVFLIRNITGYSVVSFEHCEGGNIAGGGITRCSLASHGSERGR